MHSTLPSSPDKNVEGKEGLFIQALKKKKRRVQVNVGLELSPPVPSRLLTPLSCLQIGYGGRGSQHQVHNLKAGKKELSSAFPIKTCFTTRI